MFVHSVQIIFFYFCFVTFFHDMNSLLHTVTNLNLVQKNKKYTS